MKRKLWMAVLTVMALFALVIGVAGCNSKSDEPKQLDAPVVHISEDGLASWDADKNASAYIYKIDDGAETPTQETSKQLTDGQSISVKALAKKGYKDSEYSAPQTYTKDGHAHTYGTPEWVWTGNETDGYTAATAKFSCSKCTDKQEIAAKISSSISKRATCVAEGKKEFVASVTLGGKTYKDTKSITLAVDADAHEYGEPVWDWTGSDTDGYTAATATFTCTRNNEHTLEKTATVTSETRQDGCAENEVYTATVTVSFGDKTYTDIKTVQTGGTAHEYGEWHEAEPATCVAAGRKAYQECTKCHLYFDKANTKIADKFDELTIAINENAHTELKEVQEKAPTCEEAGHEAYWQCDGCHKMYADDKAENYIENPKEIDALGHDYKLNAGEPKKLPTSDTEGEAVVTCSHANCDGDKTKTITLPVLSVDNYTITGTDATCVADGEKRYSTTIDEIKIEFTITTEALGHDPDGEWQYDEQGHYQNCTRCPGVAKQVGHTWTDTWVADGNSGHIKTTTCGDIHKQYTESDEHKYESGVCTVCKHHHDHEQDDSLETKHNDTHHWSECSVCHYKSEEVKHTYEKGICTEAGCGALDPLAEITVTYDATTKGYANEQDVPDVTEQGVVNIAFSKGSNNSYPPKYYTSGTAIRAYGGNTITVSVPTGYAIIKITLGFGSGDNPTSKKITADKGTFESPVWTGGAQSVKFTIESGSGNRRIATITVVFEKDCAHPNKLTKVDGQPARCEVAGWEEYWTCETCGRMYSSEAGTPADRISQPVVLEALEHQHTKWVEVDNEHHKSTCDLCGKDEITGDHKLDTNGSCEYCDFVRDVTEEEKVAAAFAKIVIEGELTEDYTIPTEAGFDYEIKVIEGAAAVTLEGYTLKVTRTSADVTVKISIKITFGDHSDTKEYTVKVPKKVVLVWTLVENVSQLTEGAQIVLYYTNNKDTSVVNGALNGKYLDSVSGAVTSSDKKTITTMPSAAQPLTIGKSGDNYTFSIEGTTLGITSVENGNMATSGSSLTTTWKISISNGVAQIVSTKSDTCKLQYNASTPRFTNYKTGTQQNPSIYVLAEGSTTPGGGTTTPEPHECHNKCTEAGCGLCTDNTCQDPACLPKCPGHNQGGTGGSKAFVKVTAAPSDWSGTYLIVCEASEVAFNGALGAALDTTSGHTDISGKISDGQIAYTDALNAIALTFEKSGSGYKIKTAGGYYFNYSGAGNGLGNGTTSTSVVYKISLSGSDVNIVTGSNAYLRFNPTANEMRFRFYKSTTYTSQKAIQLYQLVTE